LNNLGIYEENLTAAQSRIIDADLAKETTNIIQSQILQKAGVAVLAQANVIPTMAMKLIEG
jgi:flagellin